MRTASKSGETSFDPLLASKILGKNFVSEFFLISRKFTGSSILLKIVKEFLLKIQNRRNCTVRNAVRLIEQRTIVSGSV